MEDLSKAGQQAFRIQKTFREAVSLCLRNWIPLLAISVLAYAGSILHLFVQDMACGARFGMCYSLLQQLLLYTGTAVMMSAMLRAAEGPMPGIPEILGRIKGRLWPFILVTILFHYVIAVSALFLIVPGIYATVVFCFVDMFVLNENASITTSFAKSWRLVRGHFWKMLVIYLFYSALNTLPVLCYFWLKGADPRMLDAGYAVYLILLFPLFQALFVRAYFGLKAAGQEGFEPEDYPGKARRDLIERIGFSLLIVAVSGGLLFLSHRLYQSAGSSGVCPFSRAPKQVPYGV